MIATVKINKKLTTRLWTGVKEENLIFSVHMKKSIKAWTLLMFQHKKEGKMLV